MMEKGIQVGPEQEVAMANAVFDAVRTVLAVREYQERPVDEEVVRRIAEAAHLTASAANRQEWHFVVVRDRETLQRLGRLVRTGPYIAGATFAIVVAYQRDSRTGLSDASRAIQSMLLAAWGDGVGSNWTGFGSLENVRIESGLPDTYDVLGVLPFGYPKRKVIGNKKRKPLDEVVSTERFGTPLT